MGKNTLTYVAINMDVQEDGEPIYTLQNPNETFDLPLSKLRTAINRHQLDVVNLNKKTWQITYDYPRKYLFLQDACMHMTSSSMSDGVLSGILQYLRILNLMPHLTKCDFDFVHDLLRLLSRYFNYLRDTETIFCGHKFKHLLLWRNSVQPNLYSNHANVVSSLLEIPRLSSHRSELLRWVDTAERYPSVYSVIIPVLNDMWLQENTAIEKNIIGSCIHLLYDCLSNVYYSETGIYMYEEYMINVAECFTGAINSYFGIMLKTKLDIPEYTDKERKDLLNGRLKETENSVQDYVRRKDKATNDLNFTVNKYGDEVMAILTSLASTDSKKPGISRKVYESWLSDAINHVCKLFDMTVQSLKKGKYEDAAKIHKFIGDSVNFLSFMINVPAVSIIPKSNGLSQQWYAHNTFINSVVNASSKVKATRKTKEYLKTLKGMDSISLGIVLYKVNKLVYLATPDPMKPSVSFVTLNCNADLLPMLNLTTKCKDYKKFPVFEKYSCYELDKSLYGVGDGNYIEMGIHNPIDILWCAMLWVIYNYMDVKKGKFINDNADIAFSVFIDLYHLNNSIYPDSSLQKIEQYLKCERGWKITDRIRDTEWFGNILNKLSTDSIIGIKTSNRSDSYSRNFSSWK